MAIVTWARYKAITGDNTTIQATAEAAIADSQELLEDYLGRPLESAERTEELKIDRKGKVWPTATPITIADDYDIEDSGYSLAGATSDASFFWTETDQLAEVTYTGGYSSATIPYALERAIAKGAQEILDTSLTSIPSGATSVRLGDASITFKSGTTTILRAFDDGLVKRWRRRNI